MNKYISFSGGVESTTMCILYGKGAKAIIADTKAEHEKMYDRINEVESKLKELHGGDFEIVKIYADTKYKGEHYDSLEKLIVAQKYMPSPTSRFCTRQFKIEPIDKYLSILGEVELMIGLNVDEENSRDGNWGLNKNVKYSYPLIEDGLTRSDCEIILNQYDLHPNFPPYMLRGGCKFCFFKRKTEYKAMYYLNRKEFYEVLELEKKIQDKRGKFYSILSDGTTMQQLADQLSQTFDFDYTQLYNDYNKQGTSCGAFCHR